MIESEASGSGGHRQHSFSPFLRRIDAFATMNLDCSTEGRMRILDLDLDFFLSSIAHDQSSGGARLSEKDFKPWASDNVREFLESPCGLSTRRRSRYAGGSFSG
jgi:hypothetical protein